MAIQQEIETTARRSAALCSAIGVQQLALAAEADERVRQVGEANLANLKNLWRAVNAALESLFEIDDQEEDYDFQI